jgi:hypothetical protein
MNPHVANAMNDSAQSTLTTDAKIASLFQPDTLLSAQYFENLRRKTHFQPEKKLMWALLQDAVNSYRDNLFSRHRKKKRIFLETEQWILAANTDWIFSFDSVCEALELNPAYVRQGLLRWKERSQKASQYAEGVAPSKLAG